MARIALTDLAIRKLPHPETGQVKYRDTGLPGFGLIVGTRAKTFFCTVGKERRNVTIGRYPSVSLKTARQRALEVLDGSKAAKATTRLPGLVNAYLEDCEARLRPQSLRRFRGILLKAPDVPLADVKKTLATTAHEIAAYKAMFNWAIREGHTDKNPFAYLTATYGQRTRVLSDEELQAIWRYEYPPYSDIVKLLLLTGQRRSQIWKLEPAWIKGDCIHFPAVIMKTGHAHTIPVGPLTFNILEKALLASKPAARRNRAVSEQGTAGDIYQGAKPIFNFNGWSKAQARMQKHTGVKEWTLHDLRRTFVTINARIGTPLHVTETYVAHRSGTISGVSAVYNRHSYLEEMRQLCLNYEAELSKITALTGELNRNQ